MLGDNKQYHIDEVNLLSTSVHAYVCAHRPVCARAHAHVCTCMWKPDVNLGYCFSSTLAIKTGSLSGLGVAE